MRYMHRAPPGERRVVQLDEFNHLAVIPHNFRIIRGWTQEQAAEWYGVSVRTWQRYESDGAPQPLLNRITQWAKRRATGAENALWLTYSS